MSGPCRESVSLLYVVGPVRQTLRMSSQPTQWGRTFVPARHGMKRRIAGWVLALAGLFVIGLGLATTVSPTEDGSGSGCGRAYLILGTGEPAVRGASDDLDEQCTADARDAVILPGVGGSVLVVAGVAVLIHLRREERRLRIQATRP